MFVLALCLLLKESGNRYLFYGPESEQNIIPVTRESQHFCVNPIIALRAIKSGVFR